MTPQEQPDSQAGDEPTLDELLDLLQSRRSTLLDFNKQRIRDYAERLATDRAEKAVYDALWRLKAKNEPAWKYAEDMAVVGVGYINQELATLTKEEHHDLQD